MKKLIVLSLAALTLVGCDGMDKPKDLSQIKNDNTEKNARDRDSLAKTPLDQSENEVDRTITQKIRQAVIADKDLSMNAKNIKIITINGVVTLRGPVLNAAEKEVILKKVSEVPGILKVENQLEVA